MLILWRYIIKEHIKPFFFAISVITLVFLLNLVFRELGRILSRGLSFPLVAEFFFLNLASIIALSVPMAVLVSTLMAFGRLSGDSEIIAMKASGVSIIRIMLPILFMSSLLAIFLMWFNNQILPDFNHRSRLLASDIARKRPTLNLEAGVIYRDIPDYNILVQSIKETQDTAFVKSIFIEEKSDPTKSLIIFAEHGKIFSQETRGLIYLILYDGEMHEMDLEKMDHYRKLEFPKQILTINIPEMILHRSDSEYRGDREKSAQQMHKEVQENRKSINERKVNIANAINRHFEKYFPLKAQNIKTQKVEELEPDTYRQLSLPVKNNEKQLIGKIRRDHQNLLQQIKSERHIISQLERGNSGLLVEIHKKYSIPIACIVFILIGSPLGIMARKGNMAVATGISFVFFLIYWISLIGGEDLADRQIISPIIAMWGANIIVGISGLYLVIHSIRETTFVNWTALQNFFTRKKNK